MTSPPDTTALQAAIEPIAAYCARTPSPNAHADRCAALVNEVADYVEAVEQQAQADATGPDWQAIAGQMVQALDFPASTNPVVLRSQRLLSLPHLQARTALPLAQRMLLATVSSHHLGVPASL